MLRTMWMKVGLVVVLVGVVMAQGPSVTIGSPSAGSAMHSTGLVLAKMLTEKEGLNATVQPYASATVFTPALNSGELSFGYINAYEGLIGYEGLDYFAGRPNRELRAAAITYPLRLAIFVRKNSPIKTMADLKGKTLPSGYIGMKPLVLLLDAYYATAGLKSSDMKGVPVPNVVAGADAFIAGRLDAVLYPLGTGKLQEIDAAVGGVRPLTVPNTPKNLEAVRKHWPIGDLRDEVPGNHNPGVPEPFTVISYDALLFASTKTPDDHVYKLVKTLHENKTALTSGSPVYDLFEPNRMASYTKVPYHNGAIKYYKEKGMWPPKTK